MSGAKLTRLERLYSGAIFFLTVGAVALYALLRSKAAIADNLESEAVAVSKVSNGSGVPATSLDWSQIKYFSPDEFQGELANLDSNVVLELDALRSIVGRIIVSPAPGAVARFDLSSQHDKTNGRLSVAIDVMPRDVSLSTFYEVVKERFRIGGVGLYPDWVPYPGAHIDLRARKSSGGQATWSGINVAGKQVYRGINEALA